jgi:nucleotidyltransferase/DNA polymerase involved in DNA repair
MLNNTPSARNTTRAPPVPSARVERARRNVIRSTPARPVFHVDLDQFVVAVELLRHPELEGRPVIVGDEGDLTRRGVVAGASYEARRFGIHSAMPLRRAASRCPDLVCLPVDRERYEAASEAVMATLRSLPAAVVEVAGWDEAFLEVDTEDPEAFARSTQAAILRRTGLRCSVGIGDNKLQAKTATGLAKPGGVARLDSATWPALIGPHSPRDLPGIGPKTARRLAGLGIDTVAQLAEADSTLLVSSFGPVAGQHLRSLARGEDRSAVSGEPRRARSRGREVTFQQDIEDPRTVRAEVRRLAADVAREVAAEERPVARVVVKIRFAPFETHTHGQAFAVGRSRSLERAALGALDRFVLDRPVRLVGVRAEFDGGRPASPLERAVVPRS